MSRSRWCFGRVVIGPAEASSGPSVLTCTRYPQSEESWRYPHISYPPTCTCLALRQCPDEAAPTDLTRLRETGSTLDIWLVTYMSLWVSVSLTLAMRRRL